MLACEHCGYIFEEDEAVMKEEYTGVSSEGFHEKWKYRTCPDCGSDEIVEAYRCEYCGGDAADFLCDTCKISLRIELEAIVRKGLALQEANHEKPSRVDALNAITEVLEDM